MERNDKKINAELNSNTELSALEQTIKSILATINEKIFHIGLAMDYLKDARDASRLVERHEALYLGSNHIKYIKEEFDKLSIYKLKKIKDDDLREVLARSIDNDAIETIIKLKNRGLFND